MLRNPFTVDPRINKVRNPFEGTGHYRPIVLHEGTPTCRPPPSNVRFEKEARRSSIDTGYGSEYVYVEHKEENRRGSVRKYGCRLQRKSLHGNAIVKRFSNIVLS